VHRVSARFSIGDRVQLLDGNGGAAIVVPWPAKWTPREQMDSPDDTYAVVDARGDLFATDVSTLRLQPRGRAVYVSDSDIVALHNVTTSSATDGEREAVSAMAIRAEQGR
jgi:hypothetical protein